MLSDFKKIILKHMMDITQLVGGTGANTVFKIYFCIDIYCPPCPVLHGQTNITLSYECYEATPRDGTIYTRVYFIYLWL